MSFVPYRLTVESAAVAAADFNGDGHLDLVSAGEPQLTLFLGDGAGGLSRYSRAPGGKHPVDFALADLDEDRDIDIVVANHDTDYVTILLGDGHGTFQPAPDSPLRVDVNPHPHAVQLADFDGDGHLGLFISSATKNQFIASQMALITSFLPTFLLSGFIYEISSMPVWIQALTYAVPARYLIPPLQTIFLTGDIWAQFLPDIAVMLGFGALFFFLSFRVTRRSLD